ncbi:cyclase family protein [Singulisphaera sp. Ch08]|uniref:Cyclase family protein n=1 Tax=Singulisphaera sp. Ch08 TaxID=3120278 RepID=A0AAU7CK26_9BACT
MTDEPRDAVDLSLPLKPGMLKFPDDPDLVVHSECIDYGQEKLRLSMVELGLHLGTHLDAPSHFLKGGMTVDQIPPTAFLGTVRVVDLGAVERGITRADLEKLVIPKRARLFLKTRNSRLLGQEEYRDDHVYLESAAARHLVDDLEVRLLGFDYYNLDSSALKSLESHMVFARADVPVICALNLSGIGEGDYGFSATPLPLVGLEASPVRVFVWK